MLFSCERTRQILMAQGITKNYAMKTKSEVRNAVKSIFGSRNAVIIKDGSVLVRGKLPNSNQVGSYCLGHWDSVYLQQLVFLPSGAYNLDLAK